MNYFSRYMLFLILILTFTTNVPSQEYKLTKDSLPQEGVPKGTVTQHVWDQSKIYPGSTRDYWVYVPAQYDETNPACVMIFQDGQAFMDEDGPINIPVLFDNLINKNEMPVTIAILINPGTKNGESQRRLEYGTPSDVYASFLLEEILPEVNKKYNLVDDREGRAISGISAGGICSFIAGWERNDAFSKVVSFVGGFVRVPGGGEYASKVRRSRGNIKPLRVYLQTGENDLNFILGDVKLGNMDMANALEFAGYDYKFEMGTGGHDLEHGGANLPNTLRWLWRDYPGVKGFEEAEEQISESKILPLEGNTFLVDIDGISYTMAFGKDGGVNISGGNLQDDITAQVKPDGQSIYIWTDDFLLGGNYTKGELEIIDGSLPGPEDVADIPSIAGKSLITEDDGQEFTWKFEDGGKLTIYGPGLGDGSVAKYKQNGKNIDMWGEGFKTRGFYDGEELKFDKGEKKGGEKYEYTEDSRRQEGVPIGTVKEYSWNNSKLYPGSKRDFWIYAPAQYDPSKPACLMLFFDGEFFKNNVPVLLDNLIHKKEIPVTIGLFVNPGVNSMPEVKADKSEGSALSVIGKTLTSNFDNLGLIMKFGEGGKLKLREGNGGKEFPGTYEQEGEWVHIWAGEDEFWAIYNGETLEVIGTPENRGREYDTLGDLNARFIIEEIIPEVEKEYNLVDDPQGWATCGFSSGGSAAFNVAWERPDKFSKVISHCASYTNCRGGHAYPSMVRNTRGNPKQLRVFINAADNDLNIKEGNWTIGNLKMQSALTFARYDNKFVMGSGGHDMAQGFSIMPESMKWLWRDYPGVESDLVKSDPALVTGKWEIETDIWGYELRNTLTIEKKDGGLTGTLTNDEDEKYELTDLKFYDSKLSFSFVIPEIGDNPLKAWLHVDGDILEGPLGGDDDGMATDYPMKGHRINKNGE